MRYFVADHTGQLKRCFVQVKSGKLKIDDVKAFHSTLFGQADLGVFISLDQPTSGMRQVALEAGTYRSPVWGDFPCLQLATVEDLLEGRGPKLPPVRMTMGQADRIVKPDCSQVALPAPDRADVDDAIVDDVMVPPPFRDAFEGVLEGGD